MWHLGLHLAGASLCASELLSNGYVFSSTIKMHSSSDSLVTNRDSCEAMLLLTVFAIMAISCVISLCL